MFYLGLLVLPCTHTEGPHSPRPVGLFTLDHKVFRPLVGDRRPSSQTVVPRPGPSSLVPDRRPSSRTVVPRPGPSSLVPDRRPSSRTVVPRPGPSSLVPDRRPSSRTVVPRPGPSSLVPDRRPSSRTVVPRPGPSSLVPDRRPSSFDPLWHIYSKSLLDVLDSYPTLRLSSLCLSIYHNIINNIIVLGI